MTPIRTHLLKSVAALLVMVLVWSPFSIFETEKARAALLVNDPIVAALVASMQQAQQTKDLGPGGSGLSMDSIAWALSRITVQSLTRSLVNWINSGFQGSPAFATDLENTYMNVADVVVDRFVGNLMSQEFESPFAKDVGRIIALNHYQQTGEVPGRTSFTLDEIVGSREGAVRFLMGDFSQGGWSAFNETIWNPANHPMGLLTTATDQLNEDINSELDKVRQELDWGNGFFSWKGECKGLKLPDGSSLSVDTPNLPEKPRGNQPTQPVQLTTRNPADSCPDADREILTPGVVLSEQINQALPANMQGLIEADEINEIISSLALQLINQVVGETGLRGSASRSSGGRGAVDQAADPRAQLSPLANDIAATTNTYEQDWTTIETAARAAETATQSCQRVTDEDRELIRTTLEEAQQAKERVVKMRSFTNSLNDFNAGQNPGSGSESDMMGRVTGPEDTALRNIEIGEFLEGDLMPSAAEIMYARTESQRTNVTGQQTLVQRLEDITRKCQVGRFIGS